MRFLLILTPFEQNKKNTHMVRERERDIEGALEGQKPANLRRPVGDAPAKGKPSDEPPAPSDPHHLPHLLLLSFYSGRRVEFDPDLVTMTASEGSKSEAEVVDEWVSSVVGPSFTATVGFRARNHAQRRRYHCPPPIEYRAAALGFIPRSGDGGGLGQGLRLRRRKRDRRRRCHGSGSGGITTPAR
jgi:hypothetical protein